MSISHNLAATSIGNSEYELTERTKHRGKNKKQLNGLEQLEVCQKCGQNTQESQEKNNAHFTERDVHFFFHSDHEEKLFAAAKDYCLQLRSYRLGSLKWWKSQLKKVLPIISVTQNYQKSYFLRDFMAGISAGVAAIPIGMSYALLAGVPPQNGLYCQLFFTLVYMIFGTGRQVCVGNSAIESMMSASAVQAILGTSPSEAEWLDISVQLGFFVGIVLIVMRILGLGLFASFLADPVVSGFSTGCAVNIASSQLMYFFGMEILRMGTPKTLWYILTHLNETHLGCVFLGSLGVFMSTIINIINNKHFSKVKLPGSLFVMALFIIVGYVFRIDKPPYSIPVIGVVPQGFPYPSALKFSKIHLEGIIISAVWYAIVYFFIHSSIAKTISQKHSFQLDCNQELLATGLCSLIGSFFQCYAVGTSVARTSIAENSGAATQWYNITNFANIAVTLSFLTPLLYYLPMPAMASVVIYGVYWMMQFHEAIRLLKLGSLDFVLWAVCFSVTVIWGAMQGIIVSIALSLLWIVKDNAFPHTSVLGRLPGTELYRNVMVFPEAEEIPGCKIVCFDSSLNFSSADYFEKKIYEYAKLGKSKTADSSNREMSQIETSFDETQPKDLVTLKKDVKCNSPAPTEVKIIIIDASCISRVDVTAIRMLTNVNRVLAGAGITLLFGNWRGPMRGFLEKASFYNTLPPDRFFCTVHKAAVFAESFLRPDNLEKRDESFNEDFNLAAPDSEI